METETNDQADPHAVRAADLSPTPSMPKASAPVSGNLNTASERLATVSILLSLLLVIGAIAIMGAVPPVSRDALTHHLAVPKLWIEKGGMHEMPSIPFSYMPMNLDLLYVIPLLLGNDIVPKYIHFLFALGTMAMVYRFLKTRIDRVHALMGALLLLSTPVIVKLCINVYVDLGLVFFSWTSMVCLFEWRQSSLKTKYLIAAAVFCGLAMGTKYNGLLVWFLLTLCVPLIQIRSIKTTGAAGTAKALRASLAFALIALAVFSPWMIKNFVWTGNPVYPLYDRFFNESSGSNFDQPLAMKPWLQRKLVYHETAVETALIPVRIFFQGQDDNPKYFDGKLNPILLLFPLFTFFRFRNLDPAARLERVLLAGFAVLYLLYASFVVDMRIRYVAPAIPPLVVLAVMGIKDALVLLKNRGNVFKIGLISLVSLFLIGNAHYIYSLMSIVAPFPYLNGSVSRAAYIEKFRPEYPLVQTANRLPGSRVKILALFLGNRHYYFDKDVEFAKETFKNAVDLSPTAETLAEELLSQGFTHVMVGVGLYKNWARSVFSDEKLAIINQFFNLQAQRVDAKNGYALFIIRLPADIGGLQ